MTLTFDGRYAGNMADSLRSEMVEERGHGAVSYDDYVRQPAPHVRIESDLIRMEAREFFDPHAVEIQGDTRGSRVWATVRTAAVGGLAGLIFVAGVWFASSKEDTVSDPAIMDAKIAVHNHQ